MLRGAGRTSDLSRTAACAGPLYLEYEEGNLLKRGKLLWKRQ